MCALIYHGSCYEFALKRVQSIVWNFQNTLYIQCIPCWYVIYLRIMRLYSDLSGQ